MDCWDYTIPVRSSAAGSLNFESGGVFIWDALFKRDETHLNRSKAGFAFD